MDFGKYRYELSKKEWEEMDLLLPVVALVGEGAHELADGAQRRDRRLLARAESSASTAIAPTIFSMTWCSASRMSVGLSRSMVAPTRRFR
jgi:hypothetical protein